MNRMRSVAIGIAVAGAFACTAVVMAQQGRPAQRAITAPRAVETSRDSRVTGVNVVRLINTAEARYKYAHGSYAAWDELLRSGAISKLEKPATMFQGLQLTGGPEVVPGWTLSLVTSASGKSYELSLRNEPDPCGFSFFTDERGIIYQGGAINCTIDLKPGA